MSGYAADTYRADSSEDDLEELWQRFLEEGTEAVLDAMTDEDTYRVGDGDWEPAVAYDGIDGGYGVEDDDAGYRELAVVERPMRDGLFGFTRTDTDHVNVNEALYEVDKENTKQHEKTHHLHPKDELTIRYINGDIDVQHTISYAADNAGRIGRGNVEFHEYNAGRVDEPYAS